MELEVDEIGPSLKNATAKVVKAARGDGSDPGAFNGGASRSAPASDPWSTPTPAAGTDEPPF